MLESDYSYISTETRDRISNHNYLNPPDKETVL